MDDFSLIIDVLAVACGIYTLYTYVRLRQSGRLFPNSLLIPRDMTPKDCRDTEAYIRYIRPRIFILGIDLLAYGSIVLLNDALGLWGNLASLICAGFGFVGIIWYGVCTYKANKAYW